MAHPNVGIGMPNPNPRPAVQAPPQLPSGVKQEYIDSTLYSDAASKGTLLPWIQTSACCSKYDSTHTSYAPELRTT